MCVYLFIRGQCVLDESLFQVGKLDLSNNQFSELLKNALCNIVLP